MDTINLSIVRQSFASTVFTHKVQEVAAETQQRKALVVKVFNIGLVGIILLLLVLQVKYPDKTYLSNFATAVTLIEIFFLIIQLNFNFEEKMVMHKNSALKYLGLRDRYRSLIADIMSESISQETLISRRDALQCEYQTISDLASQTGSKDYTEAQKRLNKRGAVEGEEFSWSDAEIDWFLPENLKLGSRQ